MSEAGTPRTPTRATRKDGPRRATIYDVARQVGVSTATVSRALNGTGQIAPDTLAQIEQAVRTLGYKPNNLARSLVTRSTQTIALLLPDITNPFYPGLVKGVQDCAHRHGYMVLLCTAEGDPAGEESYLSMLRSRQVDGALVDGLRLPKARIGALVDDGFPIVSLDRDIDNAVVPLVQVDNRRGARLARRPDVNRSDRSTGHLCSSVSMKHRRTDEFPVVSASLVETARAIDGEDAVSDIADRYRKVAAGFTQRVTAVPEEAWGNPAPCQGSVARDVVSHVVEWMPSFFPAEAGIAVPEHPAVTEDPVAAWGAVRDMLQAALDDPDVARREFERHPPGRFTVEQAIDTFMTPDILVHTWDLARAAGLDEVLDADEVHRHVIGIEQLPPEVEQAMRASGRYGPRVEVPADADEQTRLLAFMGRRS
jgi:uncharacterized protein (TIGR03086 family)